MQKSRSLVWLREVAPREWVFEGAGVKPEERERFHTAVDLLGSDLRDAAKELRALAKTNPRAIDVRHHLAMALQQLGDDEGAETQWIRAVATGMGALPAGFSFGADRLPKGWLQNRPFHRAYHGLAVWRMRCGRYGDARLILENLVDLDPENGRLAGIDLATCGFRLRRPSDVLRICERFRDDGPEFMFGEALALLQLGQVRKAEAAYRTSAQRWPKVHKELLSPRHSRRADADSWVASGSAEEAFAYWERNGDFWKNTPGALEMAGRACGDSGEPAGSRRRR